MQGYLSVPREERELSKASSLLETHEAQYGLLFFLVDDSGRERFDRGPNILSRKFLTDELFFSLARFIECPFMSTLSNVEPCHYYNEILKRLTRNSPSATHKIIEFLNTAID